MYTCDINSNTLIYLVRRGHLPLVIFTLKECVVCKATWKAILYNKSLKISEIRIRKSKKDRQHNGQRKGDNRTNNDLQNTTQKTRDRATRTPLKTGANLIIQKSKKFLLHQWHPSYYSNHYKQLNPVISHEWGNDREVLTTSGTY